jgi:putative inorganic carbon (HCO3(-)) transporter
VNSTFRIDRSAPVRNLTAGDRNSNARSRPDIGARLLEAGLALFVILAPIPFGAVPAGGRLALELGSFTLLAIWAVRATVRPVRLPSRLALVGVFGMLFLAALQAVPIGSTIVGWVSPAALEVRSISQPPTEVLASEELMLGLDPSGLDTAPTFSVDPVATASALRTGAALAALFLVSCTVAATCGARRLTLALLASASFQGLYGLLVLSADAPQIWHVPKKYYLNSATGTFVNRNHFACLLAMATACGMGLILSNSGRSPRPPGRSRVLHLFSGANSRNLALAVLLVVAFAGLLTSLSRAGIALGVFALLVTVTLAGRQHRLKPRILVALLVFVAASVPLVQIGSGALLGRFGDSTEDLLTPGGRATVWGDTVRMAAEFPAVGSGFGTFASAYPIFRAPEVRLYYAHAHNDLLQLAAEGGLIGLALLALIFVPTLRNLVHALGGAKGTLAVGFAAGLTAVLLHSLVDFNFHIPANAAVAVVLAGTLEGLPWTTSAPN